MDGIWIFAERQEQTLELLNPGRSLADMMGVKLAAFAADGGLAPEYIAHGADEVFVLPPLLPGQPLESYVAVLADEARKRTPGVFLIGATPRGKEIAARLAARLNTGLCSGCTGLHLRDGSNVLEMERLMFGGKAVQKVLCSARPQMATVLPGTFEPAVCLPDRKGVVVEVHSASSSEVRIVSRSARHREGADVTEAKIIVCVGRGVESEEHMERVRELARVVGGEIACTRPIAEECQWLPEEVYLGISGKRVKPDLYIGLGVSGQIQHVAGIRESKVIFAVNRDENAPIFDAADYGIVGDMCRVVPLLIDELGRLLKV